MFSSLYLQTTNPALKWQELIHPTLLLPILGSVLFHTAVYTVFLNLVSYIFLNRSLSRVVNFRLIGSLLILMFLGFFARWVHVKDVYKTYNGNMEKTRSHLDRHYITWMFIS